MNYKGKTNLMGFNISNTVIIGVIIFVVLLFFGLYKFLRSMFTKVKSFFGNMFGTTGTEASEENKEELAKTLKKNPAVQSQMTEGNRIKTEQIFKCMDGPGTKTAELTKLIQSITGPNQMKAIYSIYGIRSLSFFPFISNWIPAIGLTNAGMSFTGDLIECVKEELSQKEFKQVASYLDLINK